MVTHRHTHRQTYMPNTDPASPRTGLGKNLLLPSLPMEVILSYDKLLPSVPMYVIYCYITITKYNV